MLLFRLWPIFFLLFRLISKGNAVTHWVVTEKGMIQSHVGSPLDLRRPYDLISLLDQEKRWRDIQSVLQDLMARKSTIEDKWTTFKANPDMQSKLSGKTPDCLAGGKVPGDEALSALSNMATNGSGRVNLAAMRENRDTNEFHVPDCAKYAPIDAPEGGEFALFGEKSGFALPPDNALEKLMPVGSVRQFGHEIHRELLNNGSSWAHYNLGTLYWRIRGNGAKAMECNRRALYFAPQEYRDIPLHNLAGILYKAGRADEAIAMLQLAIKEAPKQALHYLALGHMYFSTGDYNDSIGVYDRFLKLKPDDGEVGAIKQATVCISRLENHLVDFQESVLGYLQGILSDLHDFHGLQQHWLRLSKRLLWEHSSYDEEQGGFHEDALEAIFGKKTQRCVKKSSTISCDLVNNPISDFDTLNLQNLFQYVEAETQKINENMAKTSRLSTNLIQDKIKMDNIEFEPEFYPKYPTSMSISGKQYFDATGWPFEDECKKWNLPNDEKDDLVVPVFLPPENKGYNVVQMLGDSIDLAAGFEHKLPWYPPICDDPNAFGEKFLGQSEKHLLNNELKSNDYLKNTFLKYVNGEKTDEAEIGQRIITAIEKKIGPNWVLTTLASVYWRIRGNARKSLDCLDSALKSAPKDQTDVVLVSIASILHQLGLPGQALKYANLAFKLNFVEPSTNFLLALLHFENNSLLAMYHMKNVLRVDPDFYNGHAELLLKSWGCRVKWAPYKNQASVADKEVQEVCSEKESFKGQGMICSANGDDCKSASIQCFHTKTLEGSGGGDLEPDQSRLERIGDNSQQFQMRILLGEEQTSSGPTPEFYVGFNDDTASETLLHVYDKSGTYSLSSKGCREILDADWVHFTSMWQSIAARNVDVGPFLKPIPRGAKKKLKPYCTDGALNPSFATLNYLTSKLLRNKLPNAPDKTLGEWLGIMAGDEKASLDELGTRIAISLQESGNSWLLATAGGLYWRVVGNAEEAVVCLRLALNHVPDEMRDVPLISLANVLQRVGHYTDALEVALAALKSNPNFVVNHFTVGNVLTAMGNLEEAISFHRSALALDSSFEPARNRLQAILCTLLFDEAGTLRNIPEN